MNTISKNALTESWRALVDLCRNINFGYLEDLEIRDGEPVTYGSAIKTIMPGPGKDNGPANAADRDDNYIKPQWLEVFALATSRKTMRIRRLEIAHGGPLKLQVEATTGGGFNG